MIPIDKKAKSKGGDIGGEAAAKGGAPAASKTNAAKAASASKTNAATVTDELPAELSTSTLSSRKRGMSEELQRILAKPPKPTDEEVEELKVKLAGKIERFEFLNESHAHFLEVLAKHCRRVRFLITSSNEDKLRNQFQTSKKKIEEALNFVAIKQRKAKTLKKRLDIIDKFCISIAGDDYQPDEKPPERVYEHIFPKDTLPVYDDFFDEDRPPFFEKRDTLLVTNTLKPYVIPESLQMKPPRTR